MHRFFVVVVALAFLSSCVTAWGLQPEQERAAAVMETAVVATAASSTVTLAVAIASDPTFDGGSLAQTTLSCAGVIAVVGGVICWLDLVEAFKEPEAVAEVAPSETTTMPTQTQQKKQKPK